jgi:hypothetical protein
MMQDNNYLHGISIELSSISNLEMTLKTRKRAGSVAEVAEHSLRP